MIEKIEKALFETRPYIEYYEKLEKKIREVSSIAQDEESFIKLLEKEIQNTEEPFKTDLKIFLQKFMSI
ncbi:hypothetical protein E3E22_09260 [Thermococcus sp. MV5]|uniref:hypothetical protein n=1 Tax=Thermococcus sp. MV5 TaxID=1638272 RepID=UPI0014396FFE|nr:hypothetical protein [Thermococcus sp. MV5]NJE26796.1 hypothetical protein [Thermococcus sp. MV5]